MGHVVYSQNAQDVDQGAGCLQLGSDSCLFGQVKAVDSM